MRLARASKESRGGARLHTAIEPLNRFWSAEDETNGEPIPYMIKVLGDHAPQVEVTHPAPDSMSVNGTITVEGKASDDFGITAMRLCLQLAEDG